MINFFLRIFVFAIIFNLMQQAISAATETTKVVADITKKYATETTKNSETAHNTIKEIIQPLMKKHGIPGMSVGIIQNGESYIYNFGVIAKNSSKAVDNETLFEIGSISKTMTATLAAYAQVKGQLSFNDQVSKFIPSFKNSDFNNVNLAHLATHTFGGLPLQVPDDIKDVDSLIQHYKNWKAQYPPGTQRTYSNISIGLLGFIAAKSLGKDFEVLMQELILSKLGMQNTFLSVPKNQLKNYAEGYNEKDVPKRMSPGVFDKEAYGIRTTASDLLLFLKANMQLIKMDSDLSQALIETHRSYYQVEEMTQDLVWEQFPYPVTQTDLLAGNSKNLKVTPATKIEPAKPAMNEVWINKTGSTSGFAAYVAFIPAKKSGIVLLANKSYPVSARVTAAYEIMGKLK